MIVKPNKELFKNKLLKQLNNSIYDLYHALNDFNLSHNGILDDDFDYFQRTLFGDFGLIYMLGTFCPFLHLARFL